MKLCVRLKAEDIAVTLCIALLWIVGAQLGFYVALNQGFQTTLLWIPSGLALAGLLWRGNRAVPGLFLGAFTTSVVQFYMLSPGAISAIAIIASCAVILGGATTAYLMRLLTPTAPIWGSARDMLIGTACMAVGSAIPAFINTSLFDAVGLVPEDAVHSAIGIYWLGEFGGMVVFTAPLFIVFKMAAKGNIALTSPAKITSPTILLAVFTASALSIFAWLKVNEGEALTRSLQRDASIAANSLTRALEAAGRDLESIRALVYAHDRLYKSEFLRFSETEFGSRGLYPGAQALSWAPKVINPPEWERGMRAAGEKESILFEVGVDGGRVRVGNRDEYFPVELIYPPSDVNNRALGFDLGSERNRRKALERARDTGLTSMMAPIYLVQSDKRMAAMLMCLPIYSLGTNPESSSERAEHLTGFATGVFYIGSVFDAAIPQFEASITLSLFDLSLPNSEQWYHSYSNATSGALKSGEPRPVASELRAHFYGESLVRFAGHRWLVIATPSSSFISSFSTGVPWSALLLILTLGLGLSSILIERIAARKRIEMEQIKTVSALAEANAANESKSYFMAAASHDIKQPLYALGILTDTLLMSDLKKEMRPVIENVSKSVKEMSLHFDTLMDMGRFQDGSFEVNLGEFVMDELARRIDLEVAPLCNEKNLRWHLDLGDYAVISDPELLLRLLRNLLINAVSYTVQGDVSCIARATEKTIEICIYDTGPGLSKEQQFLIGQTNTASRQNVIDSSEMQLGFSIVNRISRALELTIEVNTSATIGTQFRFELQRSLTSGDNS
ncbi:CHASE domain-containing protein [Candidatus Marimicrobium litorale]|uniref:CHASE domain-containing protein n=1 Tax=Candidatus Marimicrobium litorale TaxID=2518991 RepID=UPI00242FCEAE|nr:CHASE domain-containing protein [Candidatus Marimicrobium litorale]